MAKTKLVEVLKSIFSYGLVLCLIWGGMIAAALLLALVVGGGFAASICGFIAKYAGPILYIVSNILVFVGLFKMYLCGEKKLYLEENHRGK